jgi:hypothetical protein
VTCAAPGHFTAKIFIQDEVLRVNIPLTVFAADRGRALHAHAMSGIAPARSRMQLILEKCHLRK